MSGISFAKVVHARGIEHHFRPPHHLPRSTRNLESKRPMYLVAVPTLLKLGSSVEGLVAASYMNGNPPWQVMYCSNFLQPRLHLIGSAGRNEQSLYIAVQKHSGLSKVTHDV